MSASNHGSSSKRKIASTGDSSPVSAEDKKHSSLLATSEGEDNNLRSDASNECITKQKHKKKRLIANYEPLRQEEIRRANRIAARKCRDRKKEISNELESTLKSVKEENMMLLKQQETFESWLSQWKNSRGANGCVQGQRQATVAATPTVTGPLPVSALPQIQLQNQAQHIGNNSNVAFGQSNIANMNPLLMNGATTSLDQSVLQQMNAISSILGPSSGNIMSEAPCVQSHLHQNMNIAMNSNTPAIPNLLNVGFQAPNSLPTTTPNLLNADANLMLYSHYLQWLQVLQGLQRGNLP